MRRDGKVMKECVKCNKLTESFVYGTIKTIVYEQVVIYMCEDCQKEIEPETNISMECKFEDYDYE